MSSGGRQRAPKQPHPRPIPIEVDVRRAQEDIKRRLLKARGRAKATAAGFLTTPPIVSNLALAEELG